MIDTYTYCFFSIFAYERVFSISNAVLNVYRIDSSVCKPNKRTI